MRPLLALLLAATLAAAEPPRLIVVVSVDQMRPDTLTRFANEYTGGLKRILARGRRYRGWIDHGATATGPGHSTMLTGCRPARTGIVGNGWLAAGSLEPVYCVGDGGAPVYGLPHTGRSPRNLLRDGLGDWMKAKDPRARVHSVAGKDRSSVLMGGLRPDGAYWFARGTTGFTTSAFYCPGGLPDWLIAFNGDGWLARLPEAWTYETVDWLRADDDPRESPVFSRTSPHPLRSDRLTVTLERIYRTPYVDDWTLRLAREVVERFDLGGDAVCDLLCVGLSATDIVGHTYGPLSQETRASTLQLDRSFGGFLDFLDRRGAPYLLALTADHGVLPMDAMKRVDARRLQQAVAVALKKRFGTGNLFRLSNGQFWVDRANAEKNGLDPADVARGLAAVLRGLEDIEAIHERATLLGTGGGKLVELARKSFHPDRSGDLVFHNKEYVLLDMYGTGTSHGSPYDYDRRVPVVFLGPGIEPCAPERDARTIDIAPTLARLAGIAAPDDLDGVVLPFAR